MKGNLTQSRKADFRRRPTSLTMADKSLHFPLLATSAKDAKIKRQREIVSSRPEGSASEQGKSFLQASIQKL
jgi:hypothetical protein